MTSIHTRMEISVDGDESYDDFHPYEDGDERGWR